MDEIEEEETNEEIEEVDEDEEKIVGETHLDAGFEAEFRAERELIGRERRAQGVGDYQYLILIKKPTWEGYRYSYDLAKQHGSSAGSYAEARSKEDMLDAIHRMIAGDWSYDQILGDKYKPPTEDNTVFHCFDGSILKREVFHSAQRGIDSFFK